MSGVGAAAAGLVTPALVLVSVDFTGLPHVASMRAAKPRQAFVKAAFMSSLLSLFGKEQRESNTFECATRFPDKEAKWTSSAPPRSKRHWSRIGRDPGMWQGC